MKHESTKYVISEPGGSFLTSDCDSYAWDCRIKNAKVYHGRVEAFAAVARTEAIIEKRIGRFVQLTVKPRSGGAPVARVAKRRQGATILKTASGREVTAYYSAAVGGYVTIPE